MPDSTSGPSAHKAKAQRDEAELEKALSQGEGSDLPPNSPKGLLGQVQPDLRQSERFEPDLNAGLSQENDGPVLFLAVLIAYFIFFPLAFFLLWRSKAFTMRFKYALSGVMVVGLIIVAVVWLGR